jgi:predicted ester cyclase
VVDGRKLVVQYIEAVFNRGDLAAMPTYLAGEAFMVGVRELVERWRTAFPDFHEEIQAAYQDGDRVISVSALSGTHLGALRSSIGIIKPTGRSVRWSRIAVRRLQDDRFADGFFEEDEVGLLKQLGVLESRDDAVDRGRHSALAEVEGR